MSNVFDDMRDAIKDAEITLRAADNVAYDLARMLVGRLRKCGRYHLASLKRELHEFDSRTGKWKS